MNRITAMLSGAIVAAGLSVGVYAHEGHDKKDEKPVTIQGELIDTACFVASDGDAKGKDHAACATKCMASGVPAGIVPEGKKAADMMYLLTNPAPLAPYGGLETQFAADGVYDSLREQGFFVIRRGDRLFALSSVCTHKGCKVRAQDDQSFFCKCHKSAFDPEGRVLNGPAPKSLPRLAVKLDDRRHLLVDTERLIEQQS